MDVASYGLRRTNFRGEPRRIGVEIEFGAVSAQSAAQLVQDHLGGKLTHVDPHLVRIDATELGDFTAELDFQYAHRADGGSSEEDDGASETPLEDVLDRFRALLGDIGSLVVPCELVCPPVLLDDLPRIDGLLTALRQAGAQGTGDNPFYAFGAQLNPDIADTRADYLSAIVKAYVLMSDWLRAEIAIDMTRRISAFTNPFPQDYVLHVIAEDYWPDRDQLISDYLVYNPTRNRELDMLPLFSWLDEDRVRSVVSDPRIKQRPTFHYRLPDAQLDDPNWNIQQEWDRWCKVEQLVERPEHLARMGRAYRENRSRIFPKDWAQETRDWIEQ